MWGNRLPSPNIKGRKPNNLEEIFNTGKLNINPSKSPEQLFHNEHQYREDCLISSSMEMNIGNIAESKESGQEALSNSLKSKDFDPSDAQSQSRNREFHIQDRLGKQSSAEWEANEEGDSD